MVALDGFENCTATVIDWPGATPAGAGTVTYGVPERLLVAFTSVTVAGKPKNTTCSGPLIGALLMLVMVTVPVKVLLTRL